jgi:hypothetical protein
MNSQCRRELCLESKFCSHDHVKLARERVSANQKKFAGGKTRRAQLRMIHENGNAVEESASALRLHMIPQWGTYISQRAVCVGEFIDWLARSIRNHETR